MLCSNNGRSKDPLCRRRYGAESAFPDNNSTQRVSKTRSIAVLTFVRSLDHVPVTPSEQSQHLPASEHHFPSPASTPPKTSIIPSFKKQSEARIESRLLISITRQRGHAIATPRPAVCRAQKCRWYSRCLPSMRATLSGVRNGRARNAVIHVSAGWDGMRRTKAVARKFGLGVGVMENRDILHEPKHRPRVVAVWLLLLP